MSETVHQIRLYHEEHNFHDVALIVQAVPAGQGFGKTYRLTCNLPVTDELLTANAWDCFEALQVIRQQLEERGWAAHCLGARRNVRPSEMLREWVGGVQAYVLEPGQPAAEPINIFDLDESPDGSTVAEQEAFARSWFESPR